MTPAPTAPARTTSFVGVTFLHPLFDYLVIGGGLSLLVGASLLLRGGDTGALSMDSLVWYLLFSNSAHFAASTVRLYTKPGSFQEWPFVTMALPLVALAVVSLAIAFPADLGRHLQSLYLTWSPYHYAAQAYGLAAMYCHRSGCALGAGDKRALYWTSLAPFLANLLTTRGGGIDWLVPLERLHAIPVVHDLLGFAVGVLVVLTFALPIWLWVRSAARPGGRMPLIAPLLVFTNGVWWIFFLYLDAFLWATIFHGLQYLAIAVIFHVREQTRLPGNQRGPLYHAAKFYLLSLGLGYSLFHLWPYAYVLAGFGLAESLLLAIAAINVHHFIVDAYIWRIARDRRNRSLLVGGNLSVPGAAPASA